jgi:hypothetical protein
VPGGSPNQADPEFVEEKYLDTNSALLSMLVTNVPMFPANVPINPFIPNLGWLV